MTPELLNSIKSAFEAANLSAPEFEAGTLFTGLSEGDDIRKLRAWALSRGMTADTFDRASRRWRTAQTLGSVPATVEEYVGLYLDRHSITAQFNGLIDAPRAGGVADYPDIGSLGRDLRLLSASLKLGFKDRPIADALDKWLSRAKHARLEAAFAAVVAPVPVDAEAEWERLADAMADTGAVSARYVASVIKAGIWQVKRKLADDPALPVYDNVMPVFTGPQGSGKSNLCRLLFGPVSDLVAATNFAEITDGRNLDLWTYPVIFLDEMEAADRSDVEAIKNAITRNTKSGRLLHTNSTATVRVRSTFWGCTNGTLSDKIADSTGLRRFAPIPVKHAPKAENIAAGLPVVDWDVINGLDYVKLWQSVDHRAEHPLRVDAEASSEWSRICESERQQDSVEAWLRQIERDLIHLTPGAANTTGELYDYGDGRGYRDWCQTNGYAPVSVGKLGRRMASLAAMPWYPFDPPRAAKRGTVHVLKQFLKLAA